MLRNLKAIFIQLVIFVTKISMAANPESTGLHLSFEQRLAMTYALLAQGESIEQQEDILARAKAYFANSAKSGFQNVKVNNFKQFLKLYKGDWPNTHSVSLDIEKIEAQGVKPLRVFKSDSPRVQRQIDEYILWQHEELLKVAKSEMGLKKQAGEQFSTEAVALLSNPFGRKIAEKIILQQVEAALSGRMKELDNVGEKIAQTGFGGQQDATTKIFMQTILSEYFARLSPASKKLIASSFLGEDLHANEMKKFEIMVQNSGPQLQKLLQIVARQAGLEPEIMEVFRRLENSVRPVPWNQVEGLYESERHNYEFIYFEREAMAVGTMAQVHRAKILVDGKRQDVVARFIKPGIEVRVEEDEKILLEVAKILDENPEFRKTGAPKLTPIIKDITATVVAELSQEDTVHRQFQAIKFYEKEVLISIPGYKNYVHFHVPRIFSGKMKESKFMMQEMVIGSKLDKEVGTYADSLPDLKRAIIEEMAKVWAYEVLFGSGFYHSDLHQGNFMVRVTEPNITVNVLDYGMGGVINQVMQRQMMVLGAGIELVNPDLIARGYWALSNKGENTIHEQQFKTLVKERAKNIVSTPEATSLERWTAWAMDNGLKLPYEFISLNRGIVTVNKLLKDAGSALTVTSLMKSFGKRNPILVYKRLVLEEKLSHEDLVKLGWKELQKMVSVKTDVREGLVRCEAVFQ